MKPVKIFTDSTCDLNKEDIERLEIGIIPLHVVFKDKTYNDGVDITTSDLYKLVEEKDELPKTAAVSPGVVREIFKPWIDKGYDIVYTGISSKLSGTLQNVNIAKQELASDGIHLVDSLSLSTGIGIILLKACALRDEGKSAGEIATALEELSHKSKCSFAIDTMDYLYKGGRCSGMTYFFGKMLRIHPVISVVDGGMIVHKTPRGKMIKALDLMVKEFEEQIKEGNVDMDHIIITHSESDEYAKYLNEKLSEIVDPKHLMTTSAGCVISSHCGPKTIGIIYLNK